MCLMPALEAISRRHAGASIELMSRFELARLAAGRTVVARAHSIDARELSALFSDETPVDPGARRFFADFDRIYSFFAWGDLRFRARLAAATDADVSFHPFLPDDDAHVSAAYLRAIDATASPTDSRLEPTPDDLAAAARALDQSNVDSSHLVVIFPGSGNPAKNWPAEKFAALALTLSKRASVAVILGPAESSLEAIFRDRGVPVAQGPRFADRRGYRAARCRLRRQRFRRLAPGGGGRHAGSGDLRANRPCAMASTWRQNRHSEAESHRFHRGRGSRRRFVEICGVASKIIH